MSGSNDGPDTVFILKAEDVAAWRAERAQIAEEVASLKRRLTWLNRRIEAAEYLFRRDVADGTHIGNAETPTLSPSASRVGEG